MNLYPWISSLSTAGTYHRENQDWRGHWVPPHPAVRQRKGVLLAVADGLGGHRAGATASQMALSTLFDAYYRDPTRDPRRSLVQGVLRANAQIYGTGYYYEAYRGMASTMTAAVVRGQQLVIANVGNSPAYLIRRGRVYTLSRDHSWAAYAVAARLLSPHEAANHPYRHVLLRSVGSRLSVKADAVSLRLQPDDILVLCTDGLSDRLTPGEIGWLSVAYPPPDAARALVERARARQAVDDVTVIVARLVPAPPHALWQPPRWSAAMPRLAMAAV
ncbi:MAG: serine/threonine-protein phosphatase [Anaerolineae bacterium]|nr:serine/threonine-protein phosphatase [Anaerolineae bacterium]